MEPRDIFVTCSAPLSPIPRFFWGIRGVHQDHQVYPSASHAFLAGLAALKTMQKDPTLCPTCGQFIKP